MNTFLQVVTLIASLGTIVALALSLRQLHLASEQSRDLLDIRRSLTTRYIAEFPNYLSEVVTAIEKAQSNIVGFCDFPAKGCFSDPESCIAYCHAIERKLLAGIPVELICVSAEVRSHIEIKQFGKSDEEWLKKMETPAFLAKVQRFFKRHGSKEEPQDVLRNTFLKLIEGEDQRTLQNTFRTAQVIEIDQYVPLYLWLVDGRAAALRSFSQ